MIDVHTHILPGVDDGCDTLAAAVALARVEVEAGVTDVVATPHYNAVYPRLSPAHVRDRVARLCQALERAGVPLRVWPGHEVALDADLDEALARQELATLNGGRYLLLELPGGGVPVTLPVILARLRQRGIIPLIAHAERERAIQRAPELLVPLVESGALVQITASSLLGAFGERAQRASALLLRHDLAHVLASDAHALSVRPPRWAESLVAAERLVGARRVRELVETVPRALLDDQPIVTRSPVPFTARELASAAASAQRGGLPRWWARSFAVSRRTPAR
jgi:protein-tyrosine phosphatase